MPSPLRLLDVDPDLGEGLSPEAFADARRDLIAEPLVVPRGDWNAEGTWSAVPAELGLLIVDGVLLCEVDVGKRSTLEVLGPGDLVRPWPHGRHIAEIDVSLRYTVADEMCRMVVLDAHLARQAARWPSVLGEITGRALGRATSGTLRLLVHQVVRIDDRILLSLWGLAERFGKVTADGVLVPLPINHTMMGRLVGAQRPTVSQAVGELTRRGALERTEDGGWLLHGEFPQDILGDGNEG
jgi:hypothetical protein